MGLDEISGSATLIRQLHRVDNGYLLAVIIVKAVAIIGRIRHHFRHGVRLALHLLQQSFCYYIIR